MPSKSGYVARIKSLIDKIYLGVIWLCPQAHGMLCGSIMVHFISIGHPPLSSWALAPPPHLSNGAAARQLSAHSLPLHMIVCTCSAGLELSLVLLQLELVTFRKQT